MLASYKVVAFDAIRSNPAVYIIPNPVPQVNLALLHMHLRSSPGVNHPLVDCQGIHTREYISYWPGRQTIETALSPRPSRGGLPTCSHTSQAHTQLDWIYSLTEAGEELN